VALVPVANISKVLARREISGRIEHEIPLPVLRSGADNSARLTDYWSFARHNSKHPANVLPFSIPVFPKSTPNTGLDKR
jgi:hypothetical protein